MTSIVGITALQELRKFKGFENAIIAGGFVRDSLMGGKFKDLDIFIPVSSENEFKGIVEGHFKLIEPQEGSLDVYVPADDIDAWINEYKKTIPGLNIFSELTFNLNKNTYHIYEHGKKKLYDNKIGNFGDLKFSHKSEEISGYGNIAPSYIGHYDGKYMGFLDVDICGYVYNPAAKFDGTIDASDFGDQLIQEFSYNIDKVYFDGDTTVQSKEFTHDLKYSEATLVKLKDIYSLPHAMRKFERLREKYPNLAFRSTVLELKEKKEEDTSHKKEYEPKYYKY